MVADLAASRAGRAEARARLRLAHRPSRTHPAYFGKRSTCRLGWNRNAKIKQKTAPRKRSNSCRRSALITTLGGVQDLRLLKLRRIRHTGPHRTLRSRTAYYLGTARKRLERAPPPIGSPHLWRVPGDPRGELSPAFLAVCYDRPGAITRRWETRASAIRGPLCLSTAVQRALPLRPSSRRPTHPIPGFLCSNGVRTGILCIPATAEALSFQHPECSIRPSRLKPTRNSFARVFARACACRQHLRSTTRRLRPEQDRS